MKNSSLIISALLIILTHATYAAADDAKHDATQAVDKAVKTVEHEVSDPHTYEACMKKASSNKEAMKICREKDRGQHETHK